MLSIDGARPFGFADNVSGSTAELREVILENINEVLSEANIQATKNTNTRSATISQTSKITRYLSTWPTLVGNTATVAAEHITWWVTTGRPMQEKINNAVNQIENLDQILTQKGR